MDVPEHPAVATITLQPTSTWRGHRAGQHVQLGVEIDGARRTTRVFTLSSPDSRAGDRITVTVRANPDGTVSRYLVEQAEVGTIVHLSQAQGDFVLPDRVPEHVQFKHNRHVAAGVACQTCHGPVEEMDKVEMTSDTIWWPWLLPTQKLEMGWCINCHRENQASTDCLTCHY